MGAVGEGGAKLEDGAGLDSTVTRYSCTTREGGGGGETALGCEEGPAEAGGEGGPRVTGEHRGREVGGRETGEQALGGEYHGPPWGAGQGHRSGVERIIRQSERRVLDGEQVAAGEKLVSLFEEHADIIVKGSRDTDYGHKLNLTTGRRDDDRRR